MMKRKTAPARRYLYIICFLAFSVIAFGGIVYAVTSQTLKQQIGNKCLGIASAVAALLEEDPEGYQEFTKSLDTESDYYIRTKAIIEKIRFGNLDNIVFLYTEIRVSENEMMYLFDGEKAGSSTFSAPGTVEPITAARHQAYESQSAHVGDFAPEVWGTLLSAYVPVFNRDTGEFLGIVGADVSVEQYNAVMQKQFAVIIGSAITVMLMSYFIIRLNREKTRSDEESFSKSSFLARMSHEMRTPLNAVIGLSEVELQNDLPKRMRDNLEKIYNAGTSLLGIVNDILDISKIESGKFELAPVKYNISNLLNDTVQLNIVRIGSKPITFELSVNETIPDNLYGDEMRIKQILNNLLSNAFKYTEKGKVNLKLDWEQHNDGAWLIFTVSDTGPGIRKENIDRLFSEYYKVENLENRYVEGTGLGLSITKNLVEAMGGTITAESEYGKGSVFSVKFRQEIVDATPIGNETAENLRSLRFMENRSAKGKKLVRTRMPYGKVLIVDDVPTNLDVARGLMLPYGLEIDLAAGGREAIEKIREEKTRYDVVFMDHMMPEMDGIEAARVIRDEIGTDYARTVPIIALTANALRGNEEMFLSKGFDAFISKPIDIMQLDTALNRWVRDRRSEETPRQAATEKPAASDALGGRRAEGVDFSAGVERYEGEKAYLKILRSFVVHTPELLGKMREVSGETLAEYAITVHGLKGASYGICAEAVAQQAQVLESAAKAGDFETIRAKNGIFMEAVEMLLSSLRDLLRDLEENFDKGSKDAPDEALLAKLLDAAGHFEFTTMEEIVTELERYSYASDGELVAWLRKQLDGLEYGEIQKRLEEVVKKTESPSAIKGMS
ncbi:MAG: response regulator [Synergistaceae bacterium]|jgi:signal transduction histidine kinase/AmiR/NasT family two-component response regulator/HPt (histidine-containing phosphotransfer) domain-containing protein|nr:response regulator [Synergistaceae bacterium]